MEIKVLGTGCASCKNTYTLIERIAQENNLSIQLSKVEAIEDIMTYGVATTPAVVIDGVVVHSGGVPKAQKVTQWLLGEDVNARVSCSSDDADQTCCQTKPRKSIFERLGFKRNKKCC